MAKNKLTKDQKRKKKLRERARKQRENRDQFEIIETYNHWNKDFWLDNSASVWLICSIGIYGLFQWLLPDLIGRCGSLTTIDTSKQKKVRNLWKERFNPVE